MIDDYDDFENERRFQERKKLEQKGKEEYARNQLRKTAKTSVETAAIGSLADYEQFFGHLWGHGCKYDELTEQEKEMREIWLDARDSILRRANNSVKILLRQIDRCEVNGYDNKRFKTIIKNKGENNGRK